MKKSGVCVVQRSVFRTCLFIFALASLALGQQNETPAFQVPGILSESIRDDVYTVRSARTGEPLLTHPLAKTAAGNMPTPAMGYQFQTLAVPVGAASAYAGGISSQATYISGGYTDASSNDYGLLFSGGGLQVLSYPGTSATNFLGVNEEGAAVGDYSEDDAGTYGLIYKNGELLGLSSKSSYAVLTGISDSGAFVETTTPDGFRVPLGFLVVDGVRTPIGIPRAEFTVPRGINDSGEIVGMYYTSTGTFGFSYLNGVYATIQVPGATMTGALGISNNGQIVGYYYGSDNRYHGFVLNNGQFATVDFPQANFTFIYGIDNSGGIVGQYYEGRSCTLSTSNCAFVATRK